MQYTTPKSLGTELSRLGMGNMRLPVKDGKIDYPQAEEMIDYLYAHGVNYYDTAYFYHNGESETFVQKALISRYPRESFYLATKLPVGKVEKDGDAEMLFNIQMDRLKTEYIDFYLLHALNRENWETAKKFGVVEFQQELKKKGIIRFAGFSFHDSPEVLEQILNENEYGWDFVQLQINYLDWHKYDAKRLYELCAERNLPVIVMEPIRGGSLAQFHPNIEEVFHRRNPGASLASWALRWVADLPQVAVILSGMSNLAQCVDNVSTFSGETALSEAEKEAIREALTEMDKLPLIPCTSCHYCSECPQGINIPGLFAKYNDYLTFQQPWRLTQQYLRETEIAHLADVCIECGNCEGVCPQRIEIIEEIARIHREAVQLSEA